jgi:hypothetical protein
MGTLNLTFSDESIRLDTPPITADQIAKLEHWLQDGMPPGWRIRALFERQGDHHQLTGYELQAGFDVFTIGTEGQGGQLP